MEADYLDGTQADGANDADVIAEVVRYFELCESAEGENRRLGLDDLLFLSGDQWPMRQKQIREQSGRPCLTINKLPTFLHQVTNDQRLNVPGVKVHPVNDADEEDSEVLQGVVRAIEYRSNASVAYNRAANSAAAIGFGFWRLVVDYENPKSFNQEIRYKSIRNQFTVHFDPMSEEPDGSDQKRCLLSTKISRVEFKRQYPKGTVTTEGLPGDRVSHWIEEDSVRVGEYYRVESSVAKLVQLPDGGAEWADELDKQGVDYSAAPTRESDRRKIMLYKLTAKEILERTEILCDWIPVFPVWGDEYDLDGRVLRSGLVRNARDPSMAYNYWITSATEEVAMRTKIPYVGAEGQFEGYEDDWATANQVSRGYLEYKPVTLEGMVVPAPRREPMADVPSGILAMAMHANDNIKATTGLFDSSLGARGNATSGIQERAQQQQGDVANYHYADSLRMSVKQCGRCIASMLPHYYDGTRVLAIMGEDESMRHAGVNPPPGQPGVDLTKLQAEVTVSTGPSYSTMRQEAVDSMVELGGKWPGLMEAAGDLLVRNMDWPGASEIADRVKKKMGIQDDSEDPTAINTPKGPLPIDQAPEAIAGMMKTIEQLQTQLQEAQAGITKAKIESQSREAIAKDANDRAVHVAELQAHASKDVAELRGMIDLLLQKLQPPPELVSEVSEDIADDGSAL